MKAADVVATLKARGVDLVIEGENLRVNRVSALTEAELAILRQHKDTLMTYLREAANNREPICPPDRSVVYVRGVACNLEKLQAEPEGVCSRCGHGHYWNNATSGIWACSHCSPWPADFTGETLSVPVAAGIEGVDGVSP